MRIIYLIAFEKLTSKVNTIDKLPHECKCPKITVHPEDWDQPGASSKEVRYIQYRFYDPIFEASFPKGKLCIYRKGINKAKTVKEKRLLIRKALRDLTTKLKQGYNPIIKITVPPLRLISHYAILLWTEIIEECEELITKNKKHIKKENVFLFSKFLKPGLMSIRPDQIGRRRKKYVKDELQIDVDFYSLKHLYSDLISEQLRLQYAQRQNAHDQLSTAKLYAVTSINIFLTFYKTLIIPY